MQTIHEPARETPIRYSADVVVAGAGLSGVAAAVSAARAGADTLLIERYGFPGGVVTAGLMASISNFFVTRTKEQVVRGFPYELIRRLSARKAIGQDPLTPEVPQIPNDPEHMKVVLNEMLEEAGIRVLYHTWVANVVLQEQRVHALLVENKAGRSAAVGKIFVDATGDGDVVARCGGTFTQLESGSASLEFRMGNVDLERMVGYFVEHPDEYDALGDIETSVEDFEKDWRERGIFHVPHGNGRIMRVVQEAIERGEYVREQGLARGLDAFGMYAVKGTGMVVINTGFYGGDHLDPEIRSEIERRARRWAFAAADFLRSHMPGFERAFMVDTAAEVGVRVTRRILGAYTLTRAECEAAARFDDVVGVAVERKPRGPRYEQGFDLPYRILLPQGVGGLIAGSGKSASTEPPGLVRGQVQCMQLGQGAGVAAALSVQGGGSPAELDRRVLQRALLGQDVYLGDDDRLRALGV